MPNNEKSHGAEKAYEPDSLVLSIDNGTQSVRALLFDLQGNLVAKSQIALKSYQTPKSGWAEVEVDYFWQQLSNCCQQLWLQPSVIEQNLKQKIVAVSLTTQRGTVINLDSEGNPLRPAILWLDQRLNNQNKPLPWYWRVAFSIIQQGPAVNYFRRKAQINWISNHQGDIWHKTAKFLLLSGYLTYRLTGLYKDSAAATVGYLPFNYRKQRWANRFDWKWHALNIKREQLPELVLPGEIIALISTQASAQTGIPAGLPLIASASDKACEVLGSGCIEPSNASLSYGTTATINTNNKRYVEPHSFIPPFPSAIPHQYNSEVMIYRGFWMVNWFKNEFAQSEIEQAELLGVAPETLLDSLVDQVPAGAQGLMLQPYWSPGIKNLEAKGAIIGFGDVHTRAHIYRAILEGLAYALREGKETLEKRQRQKIQSLTISGGGSQSNAAMQLTADIFNLPVIRPHTFETSGLGAAINAVVGLGIYENYQIAVKHMTRQQRTFYPNKENVDLYEKLYSKVYLAMYKRLKPIYQRIKDITGYPD